MVESAGGIWMKSLPKKAEDNLFVISCAEDKTEATKMSKLGIQVMDKEVLLSGLLKHSLDFAAFSLKV